jgi:hypothetical protein
MGTAMVDAEVTGNQCRVPSSVIECVLRSHRLQVNTTSLELRDALVRQRELVRVFSDSSVLPKISRS